MPIMILKTLALAAVVATTPAPSAAAADPAACALGAQLLAEQVAAGNTVFDQSELSPNYPFEETGAKLPESIRASIKRRPPRNLFQACPDLRLPAGAHFATPEEMAEVKGIQAIKGVHLTQLVEPVLDDAGGQAAVYQFGKCAGMCGFGRLSLYHRQGGAWTLGETLMQVSA